MVVSLFYIGRKLALDWVWIGFALGLLWVWIGFAFVVGLGV